MSHSLHRRGDPEDLKQDYVILVTTANGINNAGARDKIAEIIDMLWEIGVSNTGSNKTGTILTGVTKEIIKDNITKVPRVRALFYGKEKIWKAVDELQKMDHGISVVLSGCVEDIEAECRRRNIKPHSVNLSMDIWGHREDLPGEDILEVVTMCGHGLIAPSLVEYVFEMVRSGKMTPEQGVLKLSSPCVCGFFSPERGLKILRAMAPQK